MPSIRACTPARVACLLFHILALISVGSAQEKVDPSFPSILWSDFGEVARGIGHVYTAPARWETIDITRAGLALTGIFGAYQLDDETRTLFLRSRTPTQDLLNDAGNFYGRVSTGVAVSAGAYAVGLFLREPWLRGTGIVLAQTLLAAGSINVVLKPLVGRSRPYVGRGHRDFDFWSWNEGSYSLPSGHVVVAFGISSVLAARIAHPVATIALYSLAGVTAWSRIYSDAHWLSDVVVGAALATATGLQLSNRYEKKNSAESGVQIFPLPRGVQIVIRL